MNTQKSASPSIFVNDLIHNQIKSIEVYENLFINSKTKVKEGKRSIVKTIKAVKFSLLKRLDKFLDYSKEKMENLKEENILQSQITDGFNVDIFAADKIMGYLNFLEEEINYLEKLKDTIVFRKIIGKKDMLSRQPNSARKKQNRQLRLEKEKPIEEENSNGNNNINSFSLIAEDHEIGENDELNLSKSSSIHSPKKRKKNGDSTALKEIEKKLVLQKKELLGRNEKLNDSHKKAKSILPENTNELLERLHMSFVFEKNSEYIFSNLKRLINTNVIYRSEYTMKENMQKAFQSSFITEDEFLRANKNKFENVQVIILRKDNENLSAVVKSLENFFKYFIRRVDENKNQMFRGVLKCEFQIFENYFKNPYKSLNPIDEIQIDVFLFKHDLFSDYIEFSDKTNLHRYEMDILQENCKILEKIRKAYNNNSNCLNIN